MRSYPDTLPRTFLGAALLLLLTAGGAGADVGNHAFEFLRLPNEPVGRSLAGAHLASVSGPAALGWNPAGLAEAGHALALSHATWAEGTAWEWAALSLPAGPGACALSGGFFRSGELAGYTAEGAPTGAFSPMQAWVAAGYGFSLARGVRIGGAIEAAFEDDGAGERQRAWAGSFGVQWGAGPLSVGAAALHAGPGLELEEERFALPTTLRAGATLDALAGTLIHAAVDWVAGEAIGFRGGLEWSPVAQLHLLGGAGYISEMEEEALQPAAGARLDLGRAQFAYGFQSSTAADGSHQFALSLAFD